MIDVIERTPREPTREEHPNRIVPAQVPGREDPHPMARRPTARPTFAARAAAGVRRPRIG